MACCILIFWNVLALIVFAVMLAVTIHEKEWKDPLNIGPIILPRLAWHILTLVLLICTLIILVSRI